MVVGVLLIAMQDSFIGLLMTVAGVSLVVLGVVDLFHRLFPPAVVKIVTGVLITVCGWVLVQAVLYVAAALLLIAGILFLYDKLKKRIRCVTPFLTVVDYLLPIGCILIGLLLLFHQAVAIEFIFVTCGILTIVEGGAILISAFEEE